MNPKPMHGVIKQLEDSNHVDYLYRVALKAILITPEGKVLLVKESRRDWWDFPGGGIDHGESIKEGLARELFEEVSYTGEFEYEPVHVSEPHVLSELGITQIRLTFLVKPENFNVAPGEDGDEIMFIDPSEFKDSAIDTERNIYEYSQLALARV